MKIGRTHRDSFIIILRSDTGQYLGKFEFISSDEPQWSTDLTDALRFNRHADSESIAKLILDHLHDPKNKILGLKTAKVNVGGGELVMNRQELLFVW